MKIGHLFYVTLNKRIAEKLKQLRIDSKITQNDLAVQLGISIGALRDNEKGSVNIQLSTLMAYSHIFGVKVSEILQYAED